jgi:hypothetical protein
MEADKMKTIEQRIVDLAVAIYKFRAARDQTTSELADMRNPRTQEEIESRESHMRLLAHYVSEVTLAEDTLELVVAQVAFERDQAALADDEADTIASLMAGLRCL